MQASSLPKKLAGVVGELNKEYGLGTALMATDVPELVRIPTGILTLDLDIGGGVPLSRVTIFSGQEHSAKTTVALKVIANAQRIDRQTLGALALENGEYYRTATGEVGEPMQVVYLNIEGSFSRTWAHNLGVDLDRLLEVNITYQEQAFDAIVALMKTREVDLIVLDSLAQLAPSTELDSSLEDQFMAVAAKINNRGFRAVSATMNEVGKERYAPGLLVINQIRQNVGITYGNPEFMPGGKGQLYASSLTVRFRKQKPIEHQKQMVGNNYKYDIVKNKINGMLREGTFQIYVEPFGPFKPGDTDNLAQVLDVGVTIGVVEKSGAFYTLGDQKVQGQEKAVQYLLDNPDIAEAIEEHVRRVLAER